MAEGIEEYGVQAGRGGALGLVVGMTSGLAHATYHGVSAPVPTLVMGLGYAALGAIYSPLELALRQLRPGNLEKKPDWVSRSPAAAITAAIALAGTGKPLSVRFPLLCIVLANVFGTVKDIMLYPSLTKEEVQALKEGQRSSVGFDENSLFSRLLVLPFFHTMERSLVRNLESRKETFERRLGLYMLWKEKQLAKLESNTTIDASITRKRVEDVQA
jgi:hypothetical protein